MTRRDLVDLYVKCSDLREVEEEHGPLGVDAKYGAHWFHEFVAEVLMTIGALMTDEEKREAEWRLW